jgi:hypothetical protein
MTMADGDLLVLSRGSLGDGWTQTGFARHGGSPDVVKKRLAGSSGAAEMYFADRP